MKKLIFIMLVLLGLNSMAQTKIVTHNKLIIKHNEITLYLSDDTCSMVSRHELTYENFKYLGKVPRDNHWFQDTYKGKYIKERYTHTGYDLGHLTPSSITSYDSVSNHNTFSLFNQAPQKSYFNEHPWEQLEMHVQDSIAKYKANAVITTGVIYDYNESDFLPNSIIRIPLCYFKILEINKLRYVWLGFNKDGTIKEIDLERLNAIFKDNKMDLTIN